MKLSINTGEKNSLMMEIHFVSKEIEVQFLIVDVWTRFTATEGCDSSLKGGTFGLLLQWILNMQMLAGILEETEKVLGKKDILCITA